MASRASPPRYRSQADPRQQAAALTLAVAVVALLIFLLIRMGVLPLLPTRPVASTSTFDVAPDRPTPSKERTASRQQAAHHAAPPPPPAAKPPPPPPVPEKAVMPSNFIQLDGATFAQTDLRRVPRHPEDAEASETANAGNGAGDSKAPYGPGDGPGGQRLYAAAWYVEPSDTVLAPYMPRTGAPPGSWAEIACHTIERYHVENCRELGESPIGSGLSRALRRASAQFLVRPPRIGGKPMVGSWVRIHFDFVDRK